MASSPAPYFPPLEIFNWWNKAQYAIGFGVLAGLPALAYPGLSKFRNALLLIGLGVLIEVLQHYILWL